MLGKLWNVVAAVAHLPERLRWLEHELGALGRQTDDLEARVAELDVKGGVPL